MELKEERESVANAFVAAGNRQRRIHITHELGWSADKQMQCFGRTHRSDQAEPPEYVLLSTELGGEKTFQLYRPPPVTPGGFD